MSPVLVVTKSIDLTQFMSPTIATRFCHIQLVFDYIKLVNVINYTLTQLTPVSYTHLDVYKRQGFVCVRVFLRRKFLNCSTKT